MKFLVLCTEHSESHCDEPYFSGIFSNYEDARKDIEKRVAESLKEFPDEVKEDWNAVRVFRDGKVDYGCVWSVIEINDDLNFETEYTTEQTNKYGVPSHHYTLYFEESQDENDDNGKNFDVCCEDDWGDIQPCTPGDCEDWEDAIGYGNDEDGHLKIIRVVDEESDREWNGNKEVSMWYDERVGIYVDNYSR